jgi:hypothetical protein
MSTPNMASKPVALAVVITTTWRMVEPWVNTALVTGPASARYCRR